MGACFNPDSNLNSGSFTEIMPPKSCRGCQHSRGLALLLQELDGLAIAVQGADVDVGQSGPDRLSAATALDPGVHERSEVLITPRALQPEGVQLLEDAPRHAESPPDPRAVGMRALDLDLLDPI